MRGTTMVKNVALATLALLTLPAQGETVKYYHVDAVGSVRVVTDASGAVVERHDYLPFGEECATGGCASNPALGAGEPRKYTSKERDKETGLDYFGARYYAAKTGRFTAVDPVYTWNENLLDPQRWNRYAYARNNPLRYVDPDGRAVRPAVDPGKLALSRIINTAVADAFMAGNPNQPSHYAAAHFVVDLLIHQPETQEELAAGMAAAALGMAIPIEAGLVRPTALLPEKAGPVAGISPIEVIGKTPAEIGARAEQLGLEARGPNPARGRGAYVDPQTGQQRILSHSEASPPHGHINNLAGQRIGPSGTAVPPNSPAAHLPIKQE